MKHNIVYVLIVGVAPMVSPPVLAGGGIPTLQQLGAILAGRPATLGPSQTGQPNQSCQVTTTTPGDAATATGSAFNPSGTAGTVYAGQQPQNSVNSASVSQYDVACFELTSHLPF